MGDASDLCPRRFPVSATDYLSYSGHGSFGFLTIRALKGTLHRITLTMQRITAQAGGRLRGIRFSRVSGDSRVSSVTVAGMVFAKKRPIQVWPELLQNVAGHIHTDLKTELRYGIGRVAIVLIVGV